MSFMFYMKTKVSLILSLKALFILYGQWISSLDSYKNWFITYNKKTNFINSKALEKIRYKMYEENIFCISWHEKTKW